MYLDKLRYVFAIVTALFVLLLIGGCKEKSVVNVRSQRNGNTQVSEKNKSIESKVVSDTPISDSQTKLLDEAFEIASLIPIKPNIKDRSKTQEIVVDTCLELDQPVRAVRYADRIKNWRRGFCYAKTAYYLAQNGHTRQQLEKGLELAEEIADLDHGQQWRSDRIKAKIAQTYLILGNVTEAARFSKGLLDSEVGNLSETKTFSEKNEVSFEDRIKGLDRALEMKNFDMTIGVLHSFARLFDEYFEDAEKRDMVKEKIVTAWQEHKLPIPIRMELLMKLTEFALDRSDQTTALQLVETAQSMLDNYKWPPDKHVPLGAQIAEFRFKSGDQKKAKNDVDALLALYNEHETKIVDIWRAETIYPLAESYQSIGDGQTALSVYKQAVEAGIANKNLRPRAEDIAAICCSMALHALEPDTELWERIDRIKKELEKT